VPDGVAGPPAIEALGVSKAFPGVVANAGVDLSVARGEVHAILGENGAGKSTLASILAGLYRPDEGEVRVGGEAVRFGSPRDALARGVGMVYQHFRLVERFTVAENVILGDPRQPMLLSTRRAERTVAELGERYGLPVDPRARVEDLSVGEQQRVEIVKVLYRGADVLILDEPTAVLTPQEAERLFETVGAMAAEGKSVIFISHKLSEVLAVSDRVTVMRDARVVARAETAQSDRRSLARAMVGREVDLSIQRAENPPGETLLEIEDLSVDSAGDTTPLSGVSLGVRAGEIVGVAGVAGNGQRSLAEVVAGLRAPTSGRLVVCGRDVTGKGPRTARQAGLAYVPEDRLGTGLAPSLSISENLALTGPRPFILKRREMEEAGREAIQSFDIRAPGPQAATRGLSGGNAQKTLLARELSDGPEVVVVASPTRGLDVGATQAVRNILDERRRAGCAVLLISEDLDEVRSLSDRILVIYEGRIVYETPAGDADVEDLGLAMAGAR
jgi:general nucleoside transport system ATP-binding protein